MTQSIVVQVGQCGNQIGSRFWDLALKEHRSVSNEGNFGDSIESFFEVSENDRVLGRNISTNGNKTLKARAVLIDMEEGVVNGLTNGPLGPLFKNQQLIKDVSGSGNNWSVGYYGYGPKYDDDIRDCFRRSAESCDCLQCFFMLHSMGGGTGSGLGTFVLNQLADDYPDVYRFVIPIFPSIDDDVITSPYNTVLALNQLTTCADCVIPVENQALSGIITEISKTLPLDHKFGRKQFFSAPNLHSRSKSVGVAQHVRNGKSGGPDSGGGSRGNGGGGGAGGCGAGGAGGGGGGGDGGRVFDEMNNIVANLMLNLTSSSRFNGTMNVDLNEITMNLVPYPSMHYLLSSQTPLCPYIDLPMNNKKPDNMFTNAYLPSHQMMRCDPRTGVFMASALLVRGPMEVSDLRRNVDRLKGSLKFVHWNQDGWKTGMCSVPPTNSHLSILALSNNSCIWGSLEELSHRFMKLYSRKAHLHHYTTINGMDTKEFDDSYHSINALIDSYKSLESSSSSPPLSSSSLSSFIPVGLSSSSSSLLPSSSSSSRNRFKILM